MIVERWRHVTPRAGGRASVPVTNGPPATTTSAVISCGRSVRRFLSITAASAKIVLVRSFVVPRIDDRLALRHVAQAMHGLCPCVFVRRRFTDLFVASVLELLYTGRRHSLSGRWNSCCPVVIAKACSVVVVNVAGEYCMSSGGGRRRCASVVTVDCRDALPSSVHSRQRSSSDRAILITCSV